MPTRIAARVKPQLVARRHGAGRLSRPHACEQHRERPSSDRHATEPQPRTRRADRRNTTTKRDISRILLVCFCFVFDLQTQLFMSSRQSSITLTNGTYRRLLFAHESAPHWGPWRHHGQCNPIHVVSPLVSPYLFLSFILSRSPFVLFRFTQPMRDEEWRRRERPLPSPPHWTDSCRRWRRCPACTHQNNRRCFTAAKPLQEHKRTNCCTKYHKVWPDHYGANILISTIEVFTYFTEEEIHSKLQNSKLNWVEKCFRIKGTLSI